MKSLRLLLTEDCNRNCEGCCNKDFDLKNLPVCTDFTPYGMVMLTGGEPMLHPSLIMKAYFAIREQTDVPIILYTAYLDKHERLLDYIDLLDGVTITIHEQKDNRKFFELIKYIPKEWIGKKSLRLNIFKEAHLTVGLDGWKVKHNIEWIKDCPLPENEVFMRFLGPEEGDE